MSKRSDRQSFLGADSDKILKDLHVGLVGLGGGGSHIAQQLAHIGVGKYTIVDHDRIDRTNLNRLVGASDADVRWRRLKADIIADNILRILPSAKIDKVPARWETRTDVLWGCDVIVGCLDTFAGRIQLEGLARRYLIPYLDLGMDVFEICGRFAITGQVMLSMPGEPCLRCANVILTKQLGEEAQRYGAAGGRPQVVWPNGILASTAVGMLMELATPWHKREASSILIEYDGNAHTLEHSTLLPNLKGCNHYSPINSLGDPFFR